MKLEDLKTENPQAAVEQMCGLDNAELDRVAAELQGWEPFEMGPFQRIDPYTQIPVGEPEIELHFRYVNKDGRKRCPRAADYQPSENLNQAYELLSELPAMITHVKTGYTHELYYIGALNLGHKPFVSCREFTAGSHARAVTILACVGLLLGGSN